MANQSNQALINLGVNRMSHLLTAIVTALALYTWQSNHQAKAETERNARLIKIIKKIGASIDRTVKVKKSNHKTLSLARR